MTGLAFERSAHRVLNPSGRTADKSALGWLQTHYEDRGVENLLLWLGANNCLGTVLRMTICQTPDDPRNRPHKMGFAERTRGRCGENNDIAWNLWAARDFEEEYREMLQRVDDAMNASGDHVDNPRVFVATVPHVTIAPLAKGLGPTTKVVRPSVEPGGAPRELHYFKYYTYFPFELDNLDEDIPHLTIYDALLMDDLIDEYNRTIRRLVDEFNDGNTSETRRYHLVDESTALEQLAWKRNGGAPTYDMPDELRLTYPSVNTKMYHTDRRGNLKQGGIFSLDGVYPSAIGQGLIAREFLEVMRSAGVRAGKKKLGHVDWRSVQQSDTIYQRRVRTFAELRENRDLVERVVSLFDLV